MPIVSSVFAQTLGHDLVAVQPMTQPNLFYLDPLYQPVEELTVYGDGSWSLGNTFDSVIGVRTHLKKHKFSKSIIGRSRP